MLAHRSLPKKVGALKQISDLKKQASREQKSATLLSVKFGLFYVFEMSFKMKRNRYDYLNLQSELSDHRSLFFFLLFHHHRFI